MLNFVKYISLLIVLNFTIISGHSETLKGYIQEIPDNFYGNWRVVAKLIETDDYQKFKEKTVDLWNLYKEGDVIKLSNPYSGASAQITVDNYNNQTVEFSKIGKYGNITLTDTVVITIIGDNFTGTDTIKLDTTSDIDGSIIKSAVAKYTIKGERLSGQTIKGE